MNLRLNCVFLFHGFNSKIDAFEHNYLNKLHSFKKSTIHNWRWATENVKFSKIPKKYFHFINFLNPFKNPNFHKMSGIPEFFQIIFFKNKAKNSKKLDSSVAQSG